MKKYILYFMAVGYILLSGMLMTSCDDDEVNVGDVLAVKSVLPAKVITGQEVTITGTGLDKVTSVVFPGNVAVSDIKRVGSTYITVVTPAGIAAEGGPVILEAEEQSVESTMALTVGSPKPERVAPLDKEVQINECVEVYGTDLEFITRAYFPGKEGDDIVVEATDFRRKSSGALYIYTPMGIAGGAAAITIEDCSGAKYKLPEVVLSEKVFGGGSGQEGEGYYAIWEGSNDVPDWDSWQYLTTNQFDLEGITLKEGMKMRLTFDNPSGASVCVCDGWWGAPDIDGQGNNSIWVQAGTTELEFAISQGMVDTFNSGDGIIIGGGPFTLKKIEIYREYPTLWSGEYTTGWWWYLPASELDLSEVVLEAGQTIRFTFTHHEAPQTFCLCDGWWGAPFIRDGGESPNNITLAANEDFLEFEMSEGMVATMTGTETALIIGGDITITKIQIKTF